jgi:ribonuclease R
MKEIDGKPEQNVLEQLAIRSMAKAVYSTHNIGHYGLAFDHYTHFTSPIRRYPDVMAHRILATLLSEESGFAPYEKLEDKCVRCSWMERKAMDAERESVKYKQAEFMQGQVGNVFEGLISGVQQYGLFVELKENKCEGLADIDSLLNDYYLYYERENALVGRNTGKRYRLGDQVKVRVVKVDLGRRRIDFEVVE